MSNFSTFTRVYGSDLDSILKVSKSADLWQNRYNESQKSIIVYLILSSAPFLCVIILILIISGILSCIFTIRKKSRRRKAAKNLQMIENFLVLYQDTRKDRKEKDKEYISSDDDEKRKKSRSHYNLTGLGRKKSFYNLQLPDENKVPIVLVNDALAKSAKVETNTNSNNKSGPSYMLNNEHSIEMDQDVIKVINELINPPTLRRNSELLKAKRNSLAVEFIKRLRKLSGEHDKEKRKDAAKNSKQQEKEKNQDEEKNNFAFINKACETTESSAEGIQLQTKVPDIKIIINDYDESLGNNSQEGIIDQDQENAKE